MLTVTNESLLKEPPARVWTALTRFADYSRWHPFVRLSGEARAGEEIRVRFIGQDGKQILRPMAAHILVAEMHLQLGIRFGFGRLISFDECYELVPQPAGTFLIHSLTCRGFLSPFVPSRVLRGNFTKFLEASDRNLAQHLSVERRGGVHPPQARRPRTRR
ncbi:SRPBCC family protein [Sphingopyxis sp. SCN 67-31]|uniref:SRPBCC family protein n=1 Tax=Sphingopyxis sp. SCN 67-31 TaxID=1660142 RepID=UPI000868E0BE|nr:SRPBCC family protein [Sphingopyxis sp. SCN 67-31]ODU35136.1 MAG: hypothetical protein ABS88_01565 [Sphingopyxis sp. SCN 67-31]